MNHGTVRAFSWRRGLARCLAIGSVCAAVFPASPCSKVYVPVFSSFLPDGGALAVVAPRSPAGPGASDRKGLLVCRLGQWQRCLLESVVAGLLSPYAACSVGSEGCHRLGVAAINSLG